MENDLHLVIGKACEYKEIRAIAHYKNWQPKTHSGNKQHMREIHEEMSSSLV